MLILVDADATIAGVEGKVDDLGVNIPILKPLEFDDWNYEMKAFAVQVVQPGLSITGALAKEDGYVYYNDADDPKIDYPIQIEVKTSANSPTLQFPAGYDWALQYVEYQGMCSIITPSFGINAIGAFARSKPDGTGFILFHHWWIGYADWWPSILLCIVYWADLESIEAYQCRTLRKSILMRS